MEAKSGIHIKPENKGKFTAYKKRTGKTTAEALHSKDPHVRKMANFARNAAKWKHEDGGYIPIAQDGYTDKTGRHYVVPEDMLQQLPQEQTSVSRLQEMFNSYPSVQQSMEAAGRDLSQPTSTIKKQPNKPFNWGQAALMTLEGADALIPKEKIHWPVMQPLEGYNSHPYGTGSQAIAESGITVSKNGYRNGNPPKGTNYRIPSDRITMKNIQLGLIGVDNMGNKQMMHPGGEYHFPGAKYVDEYPMKAMNGSRLCLDCGGKMGADGLEVIPKTYNPPENTFDINVHQWGGVIPNMFQNNTGKTKRMNKAEYGQMLPYKNNDDGGSVMVATAQKNKLKIAQDGGDISPYYQEGSTHDLSEEEIKKLIKAGYSLKYV